MTSPIEDASSLPGQKVSDQAGSVIGEIMDVYAIGGEENPMWVTVEASTGMAGSKVVFVPISRLKQEDDEIRVPNPQDELSEEDDRRLRDYYAIDLAEQEVRTDNDSYASKVPEEDGQAQRL